MPQMAPLWWLGSLIFMFFGLTILFQILYYTTEISTLEKFNDKITFFNFWPI
uniref:ATP synthase complex subunit 8 n=1 Tax=Liposcelis bostrychophila TaxID=185214 RepID=H9M5M2_LIPBO|nr:ATP synthase F0 subunit 8 [Liposcelis bostrychophila]ATU74607.1 ATP synthase F0 subunit 8 [Liposcelis bostrychophila]ATU74620.1 ATP synthase F0 subunit 8 [Liposcelis bostrychophila]